MKRILAVLFNVEFPATDDVAEREISGAWLCVRAMAAGFFISAPAWLSGFNALLARAMAFLF